MAEPRAATAVEGAAPGAASTVGAALAAARIRLAAAGCENPRLDAELLLAAVLGVGRERLVIDRGERLRDGVEADFGALVARREAREPVAYMLGWREFRRLRLAVDRRVLIPRPETELLVEVGLALPTGAAVVDVGTGSGAVALALADERPDLRVRGLDIDPGALAVARANAARLGLAVPFSLGDLLGGEAGGGVGEAVLANLPYVPAGAELEPEITRYEPAVAVFAGADGLDLVRRLIAAVKAREPRPALLALEISPEQAAEVTELVSDAGYTTVSCRADLAGLDRVVVGA